MLDLLIFGIFYISWILFRNDELATGLKKYKSRIHFLCFELSSRKIELQWKLQIRDFGTFRKASYLTHFSKALRVPYLEFQLYQNFWFHSKFRLLMYFMAKYKKSTVV